MIEGWQHGGRTLQNMGTIFCCIQLSRGSLISLKVLKNTSDSENFLYVLIILFAISPVGHNVPEDE